MGPQLFISYGRADALDFVRRLARDLVERGVRQLFVDLDSIQKGEPFEVRIEQGIEHAAAVAAVMTPASVRADSVCRDEIVFALNAGKRLIPLRAHAAVKPTLLLARRNWIDFTQDYAEGLEALVRCVQGDESALAAPALSIVLGMTPLDFGPEMARHSAGFVGRQWLASEIDNWLAQPHGRALVLTGEPGVGKSAIAAWLATTRSDVLAVHFCTHRNTRSLDPYEFTATVASQLAARLSGFAAVVERSFPARPRASASDAFRELVVEPARAVSSGMQVLVVDALDEAADRSGETIVEVLATQAPDLPPWLRFIATSRPESRVLDRVRSLDVVTLRADRLENHADLVSYVQQRLSRSGAPTHDAGETAVVVERIAGLAQGNFLYAQMNLAALERGELKLADLGQLVSGIADFYSFSFRRRFPDPERFAEREAPLLRVLAAARAPLPASLLRGAIDASAEVAHRRLRELRHLLRVSTEADEPVYALFHKSLRDWLFDSEASGDYWCDPELAHRQLAELLQRRQPLDAYAIRELPMHLLEARDWPRLMTLLTDLDYVEAKCASGMTHALIADYQLAVAALRDGSLAPESSRLEEFLRFVQTDGHILSRQPALTRQQAANQVRGSAPAVAARSRGAVEGQRPWLELLNRHRDDAAQRMTLLGHTNWVRACGFSPDGLRIVSVGNDGVLKAWDADTGAVRASLRGSHSGLTCCAVSPDGRVVVTGSDDSLLHVWDMHLGTETATFRGHSDSVWDCAFFPDGTRCVSVGWDGTLRVWDLARGVAQAAVSGHSAAVVACAVAANGDWLVSASHDGTLCIWRVSDLSCLRRLTGHSAAVTGCAVSPDARHIASTSDDGSVRVWRADTGEAVVSLALDGDAPASCVFLRNDTVVVGSEEGRLHVWQLHQGRRRLTGHADAVTDLAFHPGRSSLLSASRDRTLKVWDADALLSKDDDAGHAQAVAACIFLPKGQRLASGAGSEVFLWPGQDATRERLTAGSSGVRSLAASADGQWLAAGGRGGVLTLWALDGGDRSRLLEGHEDTVTACCFTPDGSRLVSASKDKSVRLFELSSGRCLASLTGHLEAVTALAVSPDGRLAVSAGGADLKLWDLAKGGEGVELAGHPYEINACAFTPDGRLIASASWDHSIKLWDVRTGAEAAALQGHDWQVEALAFSPDGTRLVSGGADGVVLLWDVTSGACIFKFSDHEPTLRITACLFSPQGAWFATASRDGSLRVRDTSNGMPVATFMGPSPITASAVGPLGDVLAAGDNMGRVYIFKPHGVSEDAPLVRPVRVFRFDTGEQETVDTVRCCRCARRFVPEAEDVDVVCSCPHCGQACKVGPVSQIRRDAIPGDS